MPATTMIYVTHDQVEAMTLADRIVVLKDGRIEQVGTPMELYHHPGNLFVAQFIGSPAMNIVPATVEKPGASTAIADIGGPQGQCSRSPRRRMPQAPASASACAPRICASPRASMCCSRAASTTSSSSARCSSSISTSAAPTYRWSSSCPAMPRSSATPCSRSTPTPARCTSSMRRAAPSPASSQGQSRLTLPPVRRFVAGSRKGARLLFRSLIVAIPDGTAFRFLELLRRRLPRSAITCASVTSPTRKTSIASPLPRSLCCPAGMVSKRPSRRDAVSAEMAIVVAASGASTLPSPCSLWLTFTVSPMIV